MAVSSITSRLGLAIYSSQQVSTRDLVQDAFLLASSLLLAFFLIIFFLLHGSGTCSAQPICNSALAGISHASFKDGTHPFKGPEPAAQLANSPMSQDPTCLQMVAQVQHLSRAQASFYCIHAFLLLFLAGSSVLKLTHNLCSFLWESSHL